MWQKAAIIVAHPDDETLWAGGTILMYPQCEWEIISLCRQSDPDRAPRFFRALEKYQAYGKIADFDDEPEQNPLNIDDLKTAILSLLSNKKYDVVFTHGPKGEYTKHLRHEEVSQAVQELWAENKIQTKELCLFAYEDGGKKYLPQPIKSAHIIKELPGDIWQGKYGIITSIYNFAEDSFEAKATPKEEAFWCFKKPEEIKKYFNRKE
ncbi:MAG: PIG-L family deacetylase [Candidatus Margulisbacteria bacterium]|nr:PIG-L family deacetylase [Candidatus Margulisiibacteriota bacterium]